MSKAKIPTEAVVRPVGHEPDLPYGYRHIRSAIRSILDIESDLENSGAFLPWSVPNWPKWPVFRETSIPGIGLFTGCSIHRPAPWRLDPEAQRTRDENNSLCGGCHEEN